MCGSPSQPHFGKDVGARRGPLLGLDGFIEGSADQLVLQG